MSFNGANNTLNVISLPASKQDNDALFRPRFEDKDWMLSIYDLNSSMWIKHVQFGKEYDYLNCVFMADKVVIKRRDGLVFDKFKIY